MDPNATLIEALAAMVDLDSCAAADALHNLADWIDGGGFLPQVVDGNGSSWGLSQTFSVVAQPEASV